jgi:thioredoxin reductase (NADPH)
MSKLNSVIIIGGGCAGLTAAIYCGRAELKPLVFAGIEEDKGGLLMKTSVVENYPGFPDGIMGFDLIMGMEQQAIKYGAEIIDKQIDSVDFSKRPFKLEDSGGNVYFTNTVIICTGSKPNKLGLPNEDKLWSNGISSCAVCDGALYKNKRIVVVGGGDSAMEEALFLTKFSNVTLIHRRDEFRASKIMQDRVKQNPKINIVYNTEIIELNGKSKLESIGCKNNITGENFSMLVDGLFYGLGLTPNTEIFKHFLAADSEGYLLKNPKSYETSASIKGIFIAGDSTDKHYKQAVVACGDGCKAALDVIDYLSKL